MLVWLRWCHLQPYQEYRPGAHIVHMHGPKPNHYLNWLLTGGKAGGTEGGGAQGAGFGGCGGRSYSKGATQTQQHAYHTHTHTHCRLLTQPTRHTAKLCWCHCCGLAACVSPPLLLRPSGPHAPRAGECAFGDLCEQGFVAAWCDYAIEYSEWAQGWGVAGTLHMMCTEGRNLVEARVQWAAQQRDSQERQQAEQQQ